MANHLIIAGHGKRRNGTWDAGAVGIVGGEHRYVRDKLFPAMKKYAGSNFIFFDSYNVFSYGNLVALARKYNADTVTEIHYDAFNGRAQGGHVIIHSSYSPDAMDLRLRDVIDSMVGLRFTHKGHKGISGRNNLANVNRAARGGVNYRMLELGFGDNPRDAKILLNNVDEYARKLVEAIDGKVATQSVKTGWQKNTTGWWWQNADGSYPRNEWRRIRNQWYLFDSNGYMLTGWQKLKGKWYYMNNSGQMQTGWIKLNSHWYYLNSSGVMQRWWFKVGNTWYYANGSGRMQTGWLKDKHGRWFYLRSNGAMATGLLEMSGEHYFLQRNGVLITDEVIELEANKHGHLK